MPFGSGMSNNAAGPFEAEVNKGSINMGSFTNTMNQRWANGWYPLFVFEQKGNTVIVWCRRGILHDQPAMMPGQMMAPPPGMPPPPR